MTTRPHPKQLATGTPEDGYTVQYSSGDSIWIPTTNSVFGRTGDVIATTDDYSASQIGNDSSVSGEQVSDALEYLDGYIKDVSLLSVGGDLSGSLPNPEVTDLSIASEEQGSILYFDGTNWVQLSPGSDGYSLVTHGAGENPTWANISGGSGGSGGSILISVTPGTTSVDIPANAIALRAAVGGGGGGGSGGSTGVYGYGGSGGGGGAYSYSVFSAESLRELGSSISVTVGAGGIGGLGSADIGGGNPGTDGYSSYISIDGTVILTASGGYGGVISGLSYGGLIGNQLGGFGYSGRRWGETEPYTEEEMDYEIYTFLFNLSSPPTETLAVLTGSLKGAGGGGGGGAATETSIIPGWNGRTVKHLDTSTGALGGTTSGQAGAAGGSPVLDGSFRGRGGGGGASNISASGVGGNGGAGQTPGGGGGGGGDSSDSENGIGGDGGDGGDGLVVLEWVF